MPEVSGKNPDTQDFCREYRMKTKTVFLILSLLGLLRLSGLELPSEPQYPETPSQKVDVGGFKLNTRVMGEGNPAVIMVSGLDGILDSWTKVQLQVAEFTQCVTYDRAGYGLSEPGPEPRSAFKAAQELHILLKTMEIKPPYILVASSYGGILILSYANLYPNDIAGMIFVDVKDGTTFDRWKKDLRPEKYEQLFNIFDDAYNDYEGSLKAEWEALKRTIGKPLKMENLPDVPVVVLTSIRLSDEEKKYELTPEVIQSSLNAHKELAERFPRHTHITTEKSGHDIQWEEPELVISQIRKIVELVRSEKK
jgi:pimeloyl-ACP methyl ester carboxylesterase